MSSKKTKYLIVSHDAGGAEVISAWVRKYSENKYYFIIEGPAVDIFIGKLGNIEIRSRNCFREVISQVNLVLTGTGWGSDLEKVAIQRAKEQKVKCASYLDHWVNYPERFSLNGQQVLPDEIWCGDEETLLRVRAELKQIIPQIKLHKEPNQYFEDIKEEIKQIESDKGDKETLNILYICEPIYEHAKKKFGNGYYFDVTEKEIMDKFLSALPAKIPANISWRLRLRRHPSELTDKNKYFDKLKSYSQLPSEFSNGTSLVEDCAWADWVVGGDSMALVVGLKSGRQVFTVLPQGKLTSSLPFKEIKPFFQPACRQAGR